jgi:hypothetical protein
MLVVLFLSHWTYCQSNASTGYQIGLRVGNHEHYQSKLHAHPNVVAGLAKEDGTKQNNGT